MNQPQRFQQGRPAPRSPSYARQKELSKEHFVATPAQVAGATARRIIRELRLADTKENWRAITDIVLDVLLPDEPKE